MTSRADVGSRARRRAGVLGLLAWALLSGRAIAEPPAFARAPGPVPPARVERVRYSAEGDATRVIVMLSRAVPYEVRIFPGEASRGSERRLVLDFSNARLGEGANEAIGVENGLLKQIRTGQFTARTARVVLDLASVGSHSVSVHDNPPRVVVDIVGQPAVASRAPAAPPPAPSAPSVAPTAPSADEAAVPAPATTPAAEGPADRERPGVRAPEPAGAPAAVAKEAAGAPDVVAYAPTPVPRETTREQPTADVTRTPAADAVPGERSGAGAGVDAKTARAPRTPQRGTSWRIVLDPGHGGNDPGTQGVDGVLEKHVTLAIARRLKRRLEEGLGAQVLLTRNADVGRSLAERTAFANLNSADLFVSIHANADATGDLRGVETYTLNNTNERATMRLAKMENGPGVRTGRGDLSFILSDMVQSGKEEESVALARHLHYAMLARLRAKYPDVRNLGVKKGPFYVLVGAYMPCVLVETSFLSHPVEGRRLATPEYQGEIAEGLFRGIAEFLGDARLAKTL